MSDIDIVSNGQNEAESPVSNTHQHNPSTNREEQASPDTIQTSVEDFHVTRGAKKNALYDAAKQDDHEAVRQLISKAFKKGEFVARKDNDGKTALHHAAENDGLKVIEQLIDEVAAEKRSEYLFVQDKDGKTALHLAAYKGHLKVIEHLINKLATDDISTYLFMRDQHGETALHLAAYRGHLMVTERLIDEVKAEDKTKYVLIQSNSRNTALHFATERGHLDIIARLIKGATHQDKCITMRGHLGQTALHYAVRFNKLEATRRLISKVEDKVACLSVEDTIRKENVLHYAIKSHKLRYLETLIDRLESQDIINIINKEDSSGRTLLHFAVSEGIPYSDEADCSPGGVVLFLLQMGAKPDVEDHQHKTAWDLACTPGDEKWEAIAAFIIMEWQTEEELERERKYQLELQQLEQQRKEKGEEPLEQPLEQQKKQFKKGRRIPLVGVNNMIKVSEKLCAIAYGMHTNEDDYYSVAHRLPTRGGFENIEAIRTLANILRQVHQEFYETQEAPQHLRSREPSCIVQLQNDPEYGPRKSYEFVSLVMPYIYVGDWTITQNRESEYNDQVLQLKFCVSKGHRFFKGHMPNTLYEYCSPALDPKALESLNRDQVLGRYERQHKKDQKPAAPVPRRNNKDGTWLDDLWTLVRSYMRKLGRPELLAMKKKPKNQQHKEIPPPKKAIFVGHIWVWKIDNYVVSPKTKSYERNEHNRWECLKHRFPSQYIVSLLGELVDSFDIPDTGEESLLKTYENALALISQEVNEYTKSALIEDMDLEQEKALFHQISDLREELSMIKSVLSEQEEVWNEYTSQVWPTQIPDQQLGLNQGTEDAEKTNRRDEKNAISRQLSRTRAKFTKYHRRITKLEQGAERVERNITTKLDLKQKHASIREAHSAAMVSATVFGFTIITVIFAPLSFIVALFALPIDTFNEGKDGNDKDGVYSSSYIGKWSVTTELVSIAITLVAMGAALRFVGIHIWGKKGFREYVRQAANEVRVAEEATKQTAMAQRATDLEQGIRAGDRR